jgi:hypothetical protein
MPNLANEGLGGYSRQKAKQINEAGRSGSGTRGGFCNAFLHFIGSKEGPAFYTPRTVRPPIKANRPLAPNFVNITLFPCGDFNDHDCQG